MAARLSLKRNKLKQRANTYLASSDCILKKSTVPLYIPFALSQRPVRSLFNNRIPKKNTTNGIFFRRNFEINNNPFLA
jgi:hypothetical protein